MTGNSGDGLSEGSSEQASEQASEDASEEQSLPAIVVGGQRGTVIGVCNGSASIVLGRLVKKPDFEQMLAVPARSRSTHFAVHHIGSRPSVPIWRHRTAQDEKLSTDHAPVIDRPVDDLQGFVWLGMVVPKRHARRSVTRSLLKRQIREALASHAEHLAAGMWLIRLRAPFTPAQFPSAASKALRHAARTELDQLLTRVKR